MFFRLRFPIWSILFFILYFYLLFFIYFLLLMLFLFYYFNYPVIIIFVFIVQSWICHIVCDHVWIMGHLLDIFLIHAFVMGDLIICKFHCFCIEILILFCRVSISTIINRFAILIIVTFVIIVTIFTKTHLFKLVLLFELTF